MEYIKLFEDFSNKIELVKLDLVSKNNKKNGIYLYMPKVKIGDKYFRCDSIKSDRIISKKDIDVNSLIVGREIEPKFYKANGLD